MIKDALWGKEKDAQKMKDTKITGFVRNKGCLFVQLSYARKKKEKNIILTSEYMTVGKNGF